MGYFHLFEHSTCFLTVPIKRRHLILTIPPLLSLLWHKMKITKIKHKAKIIPPKYPKESGSKCRWLGRLYIGADRAEQATGVWGGAGEKWRENRTKKMIVGPNKCLLPVHIFSLIYINMTYMLKYKLNVTESNYLYLSRLNKRDLLPFRKLLANVRHDGVFSKALTK